MTKTLRLIRYGDLSTHGVKKGFGITNHDYVDEFKTEGDFIVLGFPSAGEEMADSVAIFEVVESA